MHSIVVCAFQIWMPINSSGWVATPTMYSLSHSEKKNALNICLCLSDLNACWLKWLSGNSYSVYYLISYVTDPIYIPIYILLDLIHENIDLEKSSTPFEGAIIREKNDDTFVSEDLTWACFTDWSMHLPLLSLWKKNTLLGFELTALIWYMFNGWALPLKVLLLGKKMITLLSVRTWLGLVSRTGQGPCPNSHFGKKMHSWVLSWLHWFDTCLR